MVLIAFGVSAVEARHARTLPVEQPRWRPCTSSDAASGVWRGYPSFLSPWWSAGPTTLTWCSFVYVSGRFFPSLCVQLSSAEPRLFSWSRTRKRTRRCCRCSGQQEVNGLRLNNGAGEPVSPHLESTLYLFSCHSSQPSPLSADVRNVIETFPPACWFPCSWMPFVGRFKLIFC